MNQSMPKGTIPQILITCGVINQSGAAPAVQPRLESVDGIYVASWFTAHGTRITRALTDIVGVSNAKGLVFKTAEILSMITPAYDDVSLLKTLVENKLENDKPRLDNLMETLGYNKYYVQAGNKNQVSLIALLLRLNKEFADPDFREEMITKGITDAMLQRISTYATRLPELNQEQEGEKAKRKEYTQEDKTEVLGIYNENIALCKVGYKLFKREPALQDQFSYEEVLSHLRGGEPANDDNNNPPPPQS